MPHLVLPTLTAAEQKAILRVTAANIRDHTIYSMALGTGLRLAELVGLNVGDVFTPDGTPRVRVRPALDTWVEDFDAPSAGKVKFVLVTGMQNGTEWSLGTDSDGAERPNTNPCP